MTALRNPLLEAASMRPLFVCVTCARRLQDKGLEKQAGSIEFGQPCECHPVGHPSIYATAIVLGPESETTTPVDLGVGLDVEEDDPSLLSPRLFSDADPAAWSGVRFGEPAQLGPVTAIATALVSSWSAKKRRVTAEMIDDAIDAAKEIVRKTRGA